MGVAAKRAAKEEGRVGGGLQEMKEEKMEESRHRSY